jgi:hypothetical protein
VAHCPTRPRAWLSWQPTLSKPNLQIPPAILRVSIIVDHSILARLVPEHQAGVDILGTAWLRTSRRPVYDYLRRQLRAKIGLDAQRDPGKNLSCWSPSETGRSSMSMP